jgi:hypothetical protein
MTPAAEHPIRGTIVIEWTYRSDDADPDQRWTWKLQADPPLQDSDLEALLTEITKRV